MGMRHAALVAVLFSGLTTGTAMAAPFKYNVGFGFGSGGQNTGQLESASVSGTITTDGTSGVLQTQNITGFDLVASLTRNGSSSSATLNSANDFLTVTGNDLSAVTTGNTSNLVFSFSGDSGSFEAFSVFAGGFTFNAGSDPATGGSIDIFVGFDNLSTSASGSFAIGSAQVSTVPLPASAPMFGAALLALAGFGYGMNRWVAPKGKKEAAAA